MGTEQLDPLLINPGGREKIYQNLGTGLSAVEPPLYADSVSQNPPLPENGSGYSQHSYDRQSPPTEHLTAGEVLKFHDDAFHAYFSNPCYFDMVTQAFGWDTCNHIEDMTKKRYKRKILEELDAAE